MKKLLLSNISEEIDDFILDIQNQERKKKVNKSYTKPQAVIFIIREYKKITEKK